LTELFSQLSAFSVFLGIAAVGFLFLLISLFFGEIFSHFEFDHDVDHDLGHGGPSFFSPRVMAVFITAFGGFGAIGVHWGLSLLGASAVGFVSGVFFASLIYMFARFLYSQQATTIIRSTDLVGQQVRVVIGIPKGGVGQVRCKVGDELIDKIARSRDGMSIPENEPVFVEESLGDVLIVRRNVASP
jgi:membrane protein implicated in regulation of membrane protease activity